MRATDPIIRQRREDVLRMRLDGAEGWDVRQYVAEQEKAGRPPWKVEDGGKPLSERQIRRYVEAADKLIEESCRTSRKKALRRHLAQRRMLFARAVSKGDERVALAVLADLARLQGLYPSEDEALRREAEALRKQLVQLKEARRESGHGNAAEGTGGAGERGEGAPGSAP
jgi:hypothetical protein